MKRRELHRPDPSTRPSPGTPKEQPGVTMSILLLFARHRSLAAAQIAKLLKVPVPTVNFHLQALLQAGFVVESTTFGRYSAGPEVVRLADNYRQEALSQGVVVEGLRALAHETGELAAYLVQSADEALCVESVEGSHIVRCSYSPGRSQPLRQGASARTILAHLPAPDIDAILRGYFLLPEKEAEIRADLQAIRNRGYATSSGALAPGVWGTSVPVFRGSGQLAGVVTTMVPLDRASDEADQGRFIELTRKAAAELTAAHAGG